MGKVTIVEIAKHAGVSFKTVSRVVNREASVGTELREKVEKSMKALGYRPNRAASLLRGGKSYTVGLILGPLTGVLAPGSERPIPSYITDVITGLIQSCSRSGYHLLIEPITADQIDGGVEAVDAMLDDLTLDGVVLVPPLCDRTWLLDHLVNRRIPCVRINPGMLHERTISIGFDNDAAGVAVAEYILARNHRQIGYIAGPENHGSHGLRFQGFERRLRECQDVVLKSAPGDFTFESGRSATAELMTADQPPTAIYAANDEMAAGVIAYARSADIDIPQQLSIIGFGDLTIARQTWPPLTTVRQPTIEISRDAAAELIGAVVNRDFVEGKVVNHPFRLIERKSFAPL